MITFALDTNIISHILRKNPIVVSRVRQVLAKGDRLIIPPIAYYEVHRGLLSEDKPVQSVAFDNFCRKISVGRVEHEMLDKAAYVYSALKKLGFTVGDADILIAAFCMVNDCTLVTNNTKDFGNIEGLNIVDWVK
ncbi:MAG: PIN domain-containing protein [Synergistaceae bacterium]|nr:PIN domain-containing protein [Synergistaceae bacterium]